MKLVSLVLGTYTEMPALSLTLAQAARLFGLRQRTCEMLFDDLVRSGRLRRGQDGRYSLLESGGTFDSNRMK